MHALVRGALGLGLVLLGGCRENTEPERAKALWEEVTAAGYRGWARPANYPTRTPSHTLHGAKVDIFVNAPLAAAEDSTVKLSAWPDGSIIVKDSYSPNDLSLTAVMKKEAGVWFWAEYDKDGEVLFSGQPKICTNCHGPREKWADWTYSLDLPR